MVKIENALSKVSLAAVQVGGELGARMRVNVEGRLKAVDVGRLTAPFIDRRNPDRFDRAWIGEHAGKFLDAAAKAAVNGGDASLRAKAELCAAALIGAQAEDGYLGTLPDAARWGDWDLWTHKYCLIGLLSYWSEFGDARALEAAHRIGVLLAGLFGSGARSIASIGPHMGMASTSVLEPICALFEATGDRRFLEFAEHIGELIDNADGPRIVSTLLALGDVHRTANGKAYEMLSNLCGLLDLHRLTGNARYRDAVDIAWHDIVRHQLYETGTVSACEHFQPRGALPTLPSSNVGETCATVTWLHLNLKLLRLTGEARFGDQIEKTVFNHLLAAQDKETGKFCYYTPLIGEKEFSDGLLCCVSSGPRGIALLPELILAADNEGVVINLLSDCEADLLIRNTPVTIKVTSDFPASGGAHIEVIAASQLRFRIRVRIPTNVSDFSASATNCATCSTREGWLDLDGDWGAQAQIALRFEVTLRHFGSDGRYGGLKGVKRGPQVLTLEAAAGGTERMRRVAWPPGSSEVDGASDAARTTPSAVELRVFEGHRKGSLYEYAPGSGRFIPFADAIAFSALLPGLDNAPRQPIPATAIQRCAMSHEDPYSNREAISDGDPHSYAILRADRPSVEALINGRNVPEPGPVWFAVAVDQSCRAISRVVFRHAPMASGRGGFDWARDPLVIEAALAPLGRFYEFLPDLYGAAWTPLASIPDDAGGGAGEAGFEVNLEAPIRAYAVRVKGWAAGPVITCAELSAWE
jgi:hypothetical protein